MTYNSVSKLARLSAFLIIVVMLLVINLPQAQVLPVFRIGVLDDENGPLTRGAQLAVEAINTTGGVAGADGTVFQLQLVVQPVDDIEASINNINQASVIAVIGPAESQTVLANREQLVDLGVPILTAATDDSILIIDTTDRIFRIRAQESLQGRALADYLINELSAASIATVQLDVASTVSVVGFQRAATQIGLTPRTQFILSEETSLEDIIDGILANMPQFVVAYGPPEETAALYNALRQEDWPGRFVYNQAGRSAFRDNVQQSLLEGILGINTWSYTLGGEDSENFTFDYIRAFGAVPTALDAAAYDAVFLLEEAIRRPGDLRSNLLAIRTFDGVQGALQPASLPAGETSNNVEITELGMFGAPVAVARYVGDRQISLEEPQIVAATSTPPPTPTPEGVFLTITRAVQNVRIGPGLNFDILGQLQEGEQARVIGANIDFSWVAINFRGTTGWLSRPILDITGDTTTVPVFTPPPSPTPPPATATPTPQPFPDIIVAAATPTRIIIGMPFVVNVTIRNQGPLNSGPFAIAATFEPGNVFSAVNLAGLAANTQTTITLNGTLSGPTGPQNVTIVADLNNQVNEGPGENNNSAFILNYVADAPLLTTAPATATLTLPDTGTVTLDGVGDDIQWGAGGIVPLGMTELSMLQGFANMEQVHRDAIANSNLMNAPILAVTPGMLIGIRTQNASKFGVIQIISATAGGNITFNYRMYDM